MIYQLLTSDGSSENAATAEHPDHFAAERWALEWLRANGADSTYLLKSADGECARSLFKTKSGHWYLTPATEPAGA